MNSHPELPTDDDITLAVLAGGAGVRMGMPKAMLKVHGQPILSWLLERLRWPGPTLLVSSAGRPIPPDARGFHRVVIDEVSGEGPARGVLTALQASSTLITLVVPVDMPLLLPAPLFWLARQLDAQPNLLAMMMTRTAGAGRSPQIEPMPMALRTAKARPLLLGHLASGRRSLHALSDEPGVAMMAAPESWPDDFWTNLNHPADLADFLSHHPAECS